MTLNCSISKKRLRQIYNRIWRSQLPTAVDYWEASAISFLSQSPLFLDAEAVFAYYPVDNLEIPFIFKILQQYPQKHYFFPKVVNQDLHFFQASSKEDFQSGCFGIPYPKTDNKFINQYKQVLIIVPFVAVDALGTRLGRGRSYYDRFLSSQQGVFKFKTIGLVPHFALTADPLPKDDWDVSLDVVIELGLDYYKTIKNR